jgi:hypothetical protein
MVRPHRLKDDDPHRLKCPRRHSSWKPIDGAFWCPKCEKQYEDGAFEEVRDAKTGDRLGREDVRELENALADDREVTA